jgi:hypothetical protein
VDLRLRGEANELAADDLAQHLRQPRRIQPPGGVAHASRSWYRSLVASTSARRTQRRHDLIAPRDGFVSDGQSPGGRPEAMSVQDRPYSLRRSPTVLVALAKLVRAVY